MDVLLHYMYGCITSPLHYLSCTQFCLVQPNTDIFSYLAKDFREYKNLTCKKCITQSCQSLLTSYQVMETRLVYLVICLCVS